MIFDHIKKHKPQVSLPAQQVFISGFIFCYIFGIFDNSRFYRATSKHFLPHSQRRPAMKISQCVTHFFNYQRMKVKKKYVAEL